MRARRHGNLWGKDKALTTEVTENTEGRMRAVVETGLAPSQGVRRDIPAIRKPRPRRGKPRLYDNDD